MMPSLPPRNGSFGGQQKHMQMWQGRASAARRERAERGAAAEGAAGPGGRGAAGAAAGSGSGCRGAGRGDVRGIAAPPDSGHAGKRLLPASPGGRSVLSLSGAGPGRQRCRRIAAWAPMSQERRCHVFLPPAACPAVGRSCSAPGCSRTRGAGRSPKPPRVGGSPAATLRGSPSGSEGLRRAEDTDPQLGRDAERLAPAGIPGDMGMFLCLRPTSSARQ